MPGSVAVGQMQAQGHWGSRRAGGRAPLVWGALAWAASPASVLSSYRSSSFLLYSFLFFLLRSCWSLSFILFILVFLLSVYALDALRGLQASSPASSLPFWSFFFLFFFLLVLLPPFFLFLVFLLLLSSSSSSFFSLFLFFLFFFLSSFFLF